ncbi:MAG: C25 family cysteine peptidase [Chitinispirillaceae bacterium]
MKFSFSFLLTIVVLVSSAYSGKPPLFTVVSVSEHRVETNIIFAQDEKHSSIAYSTDDPSVDVKIEAVVSKKDGSSRNTVVRKGAEGWYRGKYIRWLQIENEHGDTSASIIFTTENRLAEQNISIRNNILHLATAPTLRKRSAPEARLPQIPFRSGVRIEVSEDGLYEITAADLKNLGVPVSKINCRNYRLFEDGVEIPMHITGDNRGELNSEERILFYGKHLRGKNTRYTQYSNTNVYWLAWGDVPGIRYSIQSGARRRDLTLYGSGTDTLVRRASEFMDTVHFEEENDIRWLGTIHQPADIASAPRMDSTLDNWYWGFIGADDLSNFQIDLPTPASTGTARLMLSMTGLTSINTEEFDHSFSILINDNVPCENNNARWDGQDTYIFTTDTFSVSMLNAGENVVSLLKETRNFEDRAALNWIKVIYPRSYRAFDDRILFKNTPQSFNTVTQYELEGFTSREIDLWDIGRKRVFTECEIRLGSGKNRSNYSLLFQDSISTRSEYLAQSVTLRSRPESMTLDTISDMWDTLAATDYLVLSTDSFRTVLEPLMQIHEERGLGCAFVSIEDVYNRFTGGIRNPESIRLFLRYLFSISPDSPPRYLLLGGDTSHDLDKKNRDRNIVPTNMSRIPGWGPASDDGYLVTVQGEDNFADLFVGRLPARNSEEMKTMVDKTVAFIENPVRGFWRDNILLAGGGKPGENVFTVFNDRVTEEVIGPRMNILRMDADPESPYYKSEFTAAKTMADHINAGLYILNFNGHGGGNIWSDSRFFSYNDLGKLYNGNWGQSGKLPFIFSFTCLTGFFESVFYRSLGEEFVRNGRHGAISFYGASAYTSQNGNLIMNRMLLKHALEGSFESIAELIGYVEMLMVVEHGPDYIPLIRQYNLLGDPALPFNLAADSLSLELEKQVLSGKDSLSVTGDALPVRNGEAKIQVLADNKEWSNSIAQVENGKLSQTLTLKENAGTSQGLIRAYAWNDSVEVRGWIPFSKDTFLVYGADLSAKEPSFGDSVHVYCRLELPESSSSASVYCLYSISPSYKPFAADDGILMSQDSAGVYTTSRKIHLAQTEDKDAILKVQFRCMSGEQAKESRIYEFPLKKRPDLLFTSGSMQFEWLKDSLALSFQILNAGSSTAPPFSINLDWRDANEDVSSFKTVQFTDSLPAGRSGDVSVCLPDTSGMLHVTVTLNSEEEFEEAYSFNNEKSASVHIVHGTVESQSDTLISSGKGLFIKPLKKLSASYDLFLFSRTITDDKPLRSSSTWVPLGDDSVNAFTLGVRPSLQSEDSLAWVFGPVELTEESRAAVMTQNGKSEDWTYAGPAKRTEGRIVFHSVQTGPFALADISDIKGPEIQLSVAAREVKFLDYIAKDRPFNVLISDPSGIRTESIRIFLNNKELATDKHSSVTHQDNPDNLNITLYPPSEKAVDSLTVTAEDLGGNSTTKEFAYKPGEDLSIRFLSCHPNPFSAKPGPDGGTVQKIRFAFLLTDMADAELILHTSSGRRIRNWRFSNMIGYQEIEWDGRDRNGRRLANGTYYLKLIAGNDKTRVKKIIKIAKLEGYR